MLGNDIFQHRTIRKATLAFASIFDDVRIQREDGDVIKVPLGFGGKAKYIQRFEQNSSIKDDKPKVKIVVPRMAFMISGMSYDPSRQKQKTLKTLKRLDNDNTLAIQTQYSPVPYNIQFQLSILTNSIEDMLAIIEQILPFFSPEYNVSVVDNPIFEGESENFSDIPVILNNVNPIIDYDGSFDERRMVECDLDFTMKIDLYGISNVGKVIKDVRISFRDLDNRNQEGNLYSKYRVTPDPYNSGPDDDYTYNEEFIRNE